jgi:hypothetical protein
MDTARQDQLRQEAGELAARVGLSGRLGEIRSWHRRRVRADEARPLPWTRPVHGTWP